MDGKDVRDRDRTVRPRGVWGGLAIGLVGAVLAGVGVAIGAVVLTIVAVVLLVVGGTVSARSGAMYDVHGPGSIDEEAEEVVHGTTYQGVAPGDDFDEGRIAETSRALDARRERILHDRTGTAHPPLAPIAAGVLLAIGVVLLVAQSSLYPYDHISRVNRYRSLGLGIVAAATGLRFLVSTGQHAVFAAAAGLAGAAMIVSAFVSDHAVSSTVALEVTCGALVILAAAVAAASPRPRRT